MSDFYFVENKITWNKFVFWNEQECIQFLKAWTGLCNLIIKHLDHQWLVSFRDYLWRLAEWRKMRSKNHQFTPNAHQTSPL